MLNCVANAFKRRTAVHFQLHAKQIRTGGCLLEAVFGAFLLIAFIATVVRIIPYLKKGEDAHLNYFLRRTKLIESGLP